MRKVQGCCDPAALTVKALQLSREKYTPDPAEGFSLIKKIPVTSFCMSLFTTVGNFFNEEDDFVLYYSPAFPEQPGEFLMVRNGIHVPLRNVQADDNAGDISDRIPDAVI